MALIPLILGLDQRYSYIIIDGGGAQPAQNPVPAVSLALAAHEWRDGLTDIPGQGYPFGSHPAGSAL